MNLKTFYQSSDFTCGPAALITAMQSINKALIFSYQDEYAIWRKANSIFMGDGHPGCSAYGLGLAAIEYGFQVSIWTNLNGDPCIFLDWLANDLEIKVHQWNEECMKNFFLEHGIENTEEITYEKVKKQIEQGFYCVALSHEQGNKTLGHWVFIYHMDAFKCSYFDPFPEDNLVSETIENTITKDQFSHFFSYGQKSKKSFIFLKPVE